MWFLSLAMKCQQFSSRLVVSHHWWACYLTYERRKEVNTSCKFLCQFWNCPLLTGPSMVAPGETSHTKQKSPLCPLSCSLLFKNILYLQVKWQKCFGGALVLDYRLCKAALELPLCDADGGESFRDAALTLTTPLCFILCHGEQKRMSSTLTVQKQIWLIINSDCK